MPWVIRRIFSTTGQASGLEGADELLPQVEAEAILANKAYDVDERVVNPF